MGKIFLKYNQYIDIDKQGREGGTSSDLSSDADYLWGYFPPFQAEEQGVRGRENRAYLNNVSSILDFGFWILD